MKFSQLLTAGFGLVAISTLATPALAEHILILEGTATVTHNNFPQPGDQDLNPWGAQGPALQVGDTHAFSVRLSFDHELPYQQDGVNFTGSEDDNVAYSGDYPLPQLTVPDVFSTLQYIDGAIQSGQLGFAQEDSFCCGWYGYIIFDGGNIRFSYNEQGTVWDEDLDDYYGFDYVFISEGQINSVSYNGDDVTGLSQFYPIPPTNDVVPEPGSWALLIAGFGLVGTAVRRRKAALAG